MGYTKSWDTFAEQPLCSQHKWVPLEVIWSQPKHSCVPVMSSAALSVRTSYGGMLPMNRWHIWAGTLQHSVGTEMGISPVSSSCMNLPQADSSQDDKHCSFLKPENIWWCSSPKAAVGMQWVCSHFNNSRKHISVLLAEKFNTWSESTEKVQNPLTKRIKNC